METKDVSHDYSSILIHHPSSEVSWAMSFCSSRHRSVQIHLFFIDSRRSKGRYPNWLSKSRKKKVSSKSSMGRWTNVDPSVKWNLQQKMEADMGPCQLQDQHQDLYPLNNHQPSSFTYRNEMFKGYPLGRLLHFTCHQFERPSLESHIPPLMFIATYEDMVKRSRL